MSARGGCWQSADKAVSACVDHLDKLRDAADEGRSTADVKLASCDCGAVPGGCYKSEIVNGAEQCVLTKCGTKAKVGAIVGGIIGGLVGLVLLIAAAVFLVKRHRRNSSQMVTAGAPEPSKSYARFDEPDHNVEMGRSHQGSPDQPPHSASLKVALERQ